jgi:hypothetical protein
MWWLGLSRKVKTEDIEKLLNVFFKDKTVSIILKYIRTNYGHYLSNRKSRP